MALLLQESVADRPGFRIRPPDASLGFVPLQGAPRHRCPLDSPERRRLSGLSGPRPPKWPRPERCIRRSVCAADRSPPVPAHSPHEALLCTMPSTLGSRAPACRPLASLPLSCPSDLSCAFLRFQPTPSVSYLYLLCASEIISVRGGVCFTCLLNLGTKPDSSAEAVLSTRHRSVGFQVQICRDVPFSILETEASYLRERRGVASRPPPKRWWVAWPVVEPPTFLGFVTSKI